MFVEPDYRSRDVGALALEVISAIQYVQAIDFTILVADDNGSGGLVRWYEEHEWYCNDITSKDQSGIL